MGSGHSLHQFLTHFTLFINGPDAYFAENDFVKSTNGSAGDDDLIARRGCGCQQIVSYWQPMMS
jgi:hypothetical protein